MPREGAERKTCSWQGGLGSGAVLSNRHVVAITTIIVKRAAEFAAVHGYSIN